VKNLPDKRKAFNGKIYYRETFFVVGKILLMKIVAEKSNSA